MGRTQSVFPDNFRETLKFPRAGYLEYRLHQGCSNQRAKAIAPQHDDRPLNRFDLSGADPIEGAVRHFQQAAYQRWIASNEGRQLTPRDVLVIDRAHELRQQVWAPR